MRLYRGRFKCAGPRGFDLLRRALRSSKPAISPRALRLLRKNYACRAASRLLRSDHCLGSSWVLRHHTSCTNLHAAVGVGVRVRRRYPCVLRTTTGTNIFCTRTGQLQINESKCSLTFVKHERGRDTLGWISFERSLEHYQATITQWLATPVYRNPWPFLPASSSTVRGEGRARGVCGCQRASGS